MTGITGRRIGGLLGLAALVAACSSGPATPPARTAGVLGASSQPSAGPATAIPTGTDQGLYGRPGGPDPIPIAGANVTILLPYGWLALDSKSSPIAVHTTMDSHPVVADTIGTLLDNTATFVGFDAAATGAGRPATVTIRRIGDAIPVQNLLTGLARATASQIQDSQPISGTVTYQDANLPNGPAVEMVYTLTPPTGLSLALDVFLVSVGDSTYLVSFAVPADEIAGFAPVFRNVVQTLTVG